MADNIGETKKRYEKAEALREARAAENAVKSKKLEQLKNKASKVYDTSIRGASPRDAAQKSLIKNLENTKKTVGTSPTNDMGIDPKLRNSKFFKDTANVADVAEDEMSGVSKLASKAGKTPKFLKMLGKLGLAGVAASMGSKAMAGDLEGAAKEGLTGGVDFGVDKALDLATSANPYAFAVRQGLAPSEMANSELPSEEEQAKEAFNRARMGQQAEQPRAMAGDLQALTNPNEAQAIMREAMRKSQKDNSSRINNSARFKKLLPMLGGE